MRLNSFTVPRNARWLLLATLLPFAAVAASRWSEPPSAEEGDYAHYLLHAKALAEGRPYSDIGFISTSMNWTIGPEVQRPGVAAAAVVRGVEVWVPLAGLIDIEGERARLNRDLDKVLGDLEGTKKKLMNQDFLAKARPDVVQREKDRLELLDQTVSKLKRALEALRG